MTSAREDNADEGMDEGHDPGRPTQLAVQSVTKRIGMSCMVCIARRTNEMKIADSALLAV